MKIWALAIWSVLAFLLMSTNAFAYPTSPTSKTLFLNQRDSMSLISRMKFPFVKEYYRGSNFLMKRFQTSDGAIRIDCGQHESVEHAPPAMCAVTLDPTKSAAGVSQIVSNTALMPMRFRVLAKKDVANMLENMVYTRGPFYSSATILISSENIKNMSVPRFYFNCPRDWVFDVVDCEGHIIVR